MRCLMEATDKEAGQSWPDPLGRLPYSASSAWRGTLEGEYFAVPLVNIDYQEERVGSGTVFAGGSVALAERIGCRTY